MSYPQLERLVKLGEGLHVEFKHKLADPYKVMREVVAFANTKGGQLLVGVNDDKTIPGLKNPDEELYVLVNALDTYCVPKVNYTIERITKDRKREVIVATIMESKQKPVFLKSEIQGQKDKVFVRVADQSIQASAEMRAVLKGQSVGRAITFMYGDRERKLMQYLHLHNKTDIASFCKETNIPYHFASRMFVRLTLANVIKIHPNGKHDLYSMSISSP